MCLLNSAFFKYFLSKFKLIVIKLVLTDSRVWWAIFAITFQCDNIIDQKRSFKWYANMFKGFENVQATEVGHLTPNYS